MENEKGEIVDLYVDIFISVFLLGLEIFFRDRAVRMWAGGLDESNIKDYSWC